MDVEKFVATFGSIVEAPAGVDRLRGLVRDLALRGRLTEQRSCDGSAFQLLANARGQLAASIERGEVKMARRPSPIDRDAAPYQIPRAWEWSRLGDLVAVLDFRRRPVKKDERLARTRAKAAAELYPYYGATQQAGVIDGYLFDEELVLLGEDGAPFLDADKHVAYVVSGKYWVNNHAHVLRGVAVSNSYLCHVLNRTNYASLVTGTTRLKLTQGKMTEIPVPLPPLAEQRRIVDSLDDILGLCDAVDARMARRRAASARFRGSALHAVSDARGYAALRQAWQRARLNWDALTDHPDSIAEIRVTILSLAVQGRLVPQDTSDEPVDQLLDRASTTALDDSELRDRHGESSKLPATLPATWRWVPLGAVTESIQAGWSAPALQRPKEGDEWGVLKVSSCSWGKFRPRENKVLEPGTSPREDLEVVAGDFLISRANTSELVGRSVVVAQTPPRLMLSDKTLRISVVEGCSPTYLNLANLAPAARAHYIGAASGTSDSMKNVSQRTIRRTPIPLPPAGEQVRIVDEVARLYDICDQLETYLQVQRDASQRLASALTSV